MKVYLEVGSKRTFAGALDWPGWTRGGPDEDAALRALLDYAPRYARVLGGASAFLPPADTGGFEIVEHLRGNATTDFGAPGGIPTADQKLLTGRELEQLQAALEAAWRAFDRAMKRTASRELRKGPRGGGRDHAGIARHVFDAERGYLNQLGAKHAAGDETDPMALLPALRAAVLDALANPPEPGPGRGGKPRRLWTARYFIRRAAWHVLDHAWEMEDRAVPEG